MRNSRNILKQLYILGTFLAIYAYKYINFYDIVNPNNHINEKDNLTVFDICLSIGIDLYKKEFSKKLFNALDEYIKNK